MSFKSGQSLIEILVAVGVGTIMLLGAITALSPAIKSQTDVNRSQVGAALGAELLDNARVFAEANWHNIDSLPVGSANKYFLNTGTSTFLIATGTEAVPGDQTASGLVGYWKFDDASGTQAMDFSLSRLNGIWNGAGVHYATSTMGSAGQFNGTNDYVSCGTSTNLDFGAGTNFTISFWTKFANSGNYQNFVSKGSGSVSNSGDHTVGFVIGYNVVAHQFGSFVADGTNISTLTIAYTPDSLWHHIAVVYSRAGSQTMYLDGKPIGSIAMSSIGSVTSPAAFNIGKNNGGPDFLNGLIDEVRVYNRALSASEIYNIYNANIFYRDFYLTSVNRDSGGFGYINSGGSNDPSTRLLTVEYRWGTVPIKIISTYLTRHADAALWQTDWANGGNVAGPASTTLGNQFSTSSGTDYATTTGSLRIIGL